MAHRKVIVVTGANRGIGKGIVQLLAKQQLEHSLVIYATSRSGSDGSIEPSDPNLIFYRKLDITNQDSVESFFGSVLEEHTSIDILINNAAICNDHCETPELAAKTIWTNYGGTRDMCKAFLAQPSLRSGSRIVNVTSGYNRLQNYGPDLQNVFRKAGSISTLDSLADVYLGSVLSGQAAQEEAGWGSGARSYKVSKALVNALTVLLAQQHPDILVNCCCPGWVDTAMGNQAKGRPPKTPIEGARVPTRLAIGSLGPDGDESGGLGKDSERISGHFFENDTIVQPGWGRAKLWLEL